NFLWLSIVPYIWHVPHINEISRFERTVLRAGKVEIHGPETPDFFTSHCRQRNQFPLSNRALNYRLFIPPRLINIGCQIVAFMIVYANVANIDVRFAEFLSRGVSG